MFIGCNVNGPENHLRKFKQKEAEEKINDKLANAKEKNSPAPVDKNLYIPVELNGNSGSETYTAYNFEYNGIRYIGLFLDNQSTNAAAVVDYSQFFEGDTLFVSGRTWVALTDAPKTNNNE